MLFTACTFWFKGMDSSYSAAVSRVFALLYASNSSCFKSKSSRLDSSTGCGNVTGCLLNGLVMVG